MISADSQAILYALLGGIIPALVWLWFWTKEDKQRPEPRGLIALSFFGGALAAVAVFPMEKFAFNVIPEGIYLIIAWAAIEEIIKFSSVSIIALKSRFFDEPIDAMIYLITAALGFAAMENSFFLIKPLLAGEGLQVFLLGNMRFIGASVLHVVASSAVGIAIGLSFYKSRAVKVLSLTLGVITAVSLHSLFNYFIIKGNGENTFAVFLSLWLMVVLVILLFEKVKTIVRRGTQTKEESSGVAAPADKMSQPKKSLGELGKMSDLSQH